MKLEIERLKLNISAAERDRALLSVGMDPATINPNTLVDEVYMGRLSKVASTLALLGEASLEDKLIAAIGLGTVDDNAIDFWNIIRIGEICSGGKCEVRAEIKKAVHSSNIVPSAGPSEPVFLCSQCERKVCRVCCAGRGALLLAGYNSRDFMNYNGASSQSISSYGGQVDLPINRLLARDGIICKRCCQDTVLDALILDYVRVLISLRRTDRVEKAAYNALKQIIGSSWDCLLEKNQASDNQSAGKAVQLLLNGYESLAEFPLASFLHLVYFYNSMSVLILGPAAFCFDFLTWTIKSHATVSINNVLFCDARLISTKARMGLNINYLKKYSIGWFIDIYCCKSKGSTGYS